MQVLDDIIGSTSFLEEPAFAMLLGTNPASSYLFRSLNKTDSYVNPVSSSFSWQPKKDRPLVCVPVFLFDLFFGPR